MMANGDDDPLQVLDLSDFSSEVLKFFPPARAWALALSCPCARARDDGNSRRRRHLPSRVESLQ